MRNLPTSLVSFAITASIASFAVACGGSTGPSAEEVARQRSHLTKVISKEIIRREQLAGQRAAKRAEAACRLQVGNALDSLGSLKRTMGSYLTVRSYGDAIDELNRALDRVPRGSLTSKCLMVVDKIENSVSDNEGTYRLFYNCAVLYTETCDVGDSSHQSILKFSTGFTASSFRNASRALEAIGRARTKPVRPSVFLPRTDASVKETVYGIAVEYFCGTNVKDSATDPCQDLRDVLAGGVEAGEESDLNDALTGVLRAYGLVADTSSETA